MAETLQPPNSTAPGNGGTAPGTSGPQTSAGDPAGGDPFLEQFFARIPAQAAQSFTADQLLAVKMAFGTRDWGMHTVDLRFSIPLLRYYFVLVMGPEKRTKERRRKDKKFRPVNSLTNGFAVLLLLALLAVPVGLTLYAVKSGLGVNLIEETGGHGLLGELKRQIILFLQ